MNESRRGEVSDRTLVDLVTRAMVATGQPGRAVGLLVTAAVMLATVAEDAGAFEGCRRSTARDAVEGVVGDAFTTPALLAAGRRLFVLDATPATDGEKPAEIVPVPRVPGRVQ